jgi:chemotaxis protein CheX
MNAEIINPFLESMKNILATMATMEITADKPSIKKDNTARGDVTGVIGMTSPQAKGSLAITFTESLLREICKRMLGEEIDGMDDTATDLAGEITNMVSGGAKRLLGEKGYMFEMAIPAVISGKGHAVHHKSQGPKILIPFTSDYGKLFIEVCFDS